MGKYDYEPRKPSELMRVPSEFKTYVDRISIQTGVSKIDVLRELVARKRRARDYFDTSDLIRL